MVLDNQKKMELLAPAGTIEAYEAAVAAGADAVYIGAPAFNARALARHFSLAEIAAMVSHAHSNGAKLFVAMNSLLKEAEIPQAVSLLAALAAIKIDALIIQDLGIHYLVKKYFPEIRMHASTLMAAHNVSAVRQFAAMGFSRVVLARELTIEEIKQIHDETGVELEVFGHGAMCFSVSGLCLFSSYLGGKSGLRGRCVQPCRRRYTWTGPGRESGGYFFSMNDLSSVDLLPQLRKSGVASLKIEGRMRSAQYVWSVVSAYRRMLDSPDDDPDALAAATAFLAEAMGRKETPGFFVSSKPKDIISPYYSGNIGNFLGKISHTRGNWASLTVRGSLRVGDRLRLHLEKSGERESFTLRKMQVNDRPVEATEKGVKVTVEVPFKSSVGDSLYLVDFQEFKDIKKAGREGGVKQHLRKKLDQRQIDERASRILADIEKREDFTQGHNQGRKGVDRQNPLSSARKMPMSWWVKIDDLRLLSLNIPIRPDKLVVLLGRETFNQAAYLKKDLRRQRRTLIWALPPIIFPTELEFYKQAIASLLAEGFREWLSAHIGQVDLLAEIVNSINSNKVEQVEARTSTHGRRRSEDLIPSVKSMADIVLHGDYTLNIMNSLGIKVVSELGVASVELSIEADQESLGRILQQKSRCRQGLTVYGLPALFTARACPDHFKFDRVFVSPRQEKFILKQRCGLTVALPEKPFSLLPYLTGLAALGLDFVVVDLCCMQKRRADLAELFSELIKPRKELKAGTFNFLGNLL